GLEADITSVTRENDFGDFFCGEGGVYSACRARNLKGFKMDKLHGSCHDLLTNIGMANATRGVLSIKEGGMIGGGPPCSLFVFMSSSYHKRTKVTPLGDESKSQVLQANYIAAFWVFLLTIASIRRVWWWTEQPGTSKMFNLPCWEKFQDMLDHLHAYRFINFWMGNWGHDIPKPTIIVTNCLALNSLVLANAGEKPQ
ncbi:unnamed protein product, partial [Prorocentrum cordatum]